MGKLFVTVLSVALAVGVFTAIWVGVNLIFNQSTKDWSKFSVLAGGLVGFAFFGIIHGNRLITHFPGMEETREALTWGNERDPTMFLGNIAALMWWALPGAAIGALIGYLLSKTEDPQRRLVIGLASGLIIGLIISFTLKSANMPRLRTVPMIAWPVVFGVIGYGWSAWRKRRLAQSIAGWVGLGWLIGTFGGSNSGGGPLLETLLAVMVPALLFGFVLGSTRYPDVVTRTRVDQKSRAWIFMAPALLFISATLVIPGIITLILSFRDDDREGFVGIDNYSGIIRNNGEWNEANFDLTEWSDFFTSRLFFIGVPLLLAGLVIASLAGRKVGRARDWAPESGFLSLAGVVLLVFGLFSVLRGTIFNNLWWVFTVTVFATVIGLAVAAWSDGAKGERIAKSIIFMPMAISFVGASIIWRFMYRSQQAGRDQTGVLNAMWNWLGSKTAGAAPLQGDSPDYDPERYTNLGIGILDFELFNFPAKWLFVAIFAAITLWFIRKAAAAYSLHGELPAITWAIFALLPLYLTWRTATEGIGGYAIAEDGTVGPSPVFFLQDIPFNNVWLMVVLLWMEVGFAMVILSAAIKAVPAEYIEAAKIDGADDSAVFWRIVVPQIAPTIGVVVTTVVVRVTKVYDIVAVMTGGTSQTDVLANQMINQSFQFSRTGVGSALAIILFLAVLPVMVLNIRRMQQEAKA